MSNYETEFKFLISNLPVKNFEKAKKYYIKQTYFNGKSKLDILGGLFSDVDFKMINTYRIRYVETDGEKKNILTIKSSALPNGLSRVEEEREVSEEVAKSLVSDADTNTIVKNRYVDNYNGYNFEFDEYLNLNTKLFTVEVEVSSDVKYEEEVDQFIKMINDHYGLECRDVTFDPVYKNSNLRKFFGR